MYLLFTSVTWKKRDRTLYTLLFVLKLHSSEEKISTRIEFFKWEKRESCMKFECKHMHPLMPTTIKTSENLPVFFSITGLPISAFHCFDHANAGGPLKHFIHLSFTEQNTDHIFLHCYEPCSSNETM